MTPDRQALERAARAYLAACDVESIDSETWYRAVVDARDALRAALARETPTPPTPAEGRGEEAVARLARFIMENIPGEPSRSEGAVDCAIRLLARSIPHGDGGGKGAK